MLDTTEACAKCANLMRASFNDCGFVLDRMVLRAMERSS